MSPARFYFGVRIVSSMSQLGDPYPLRHIAFVETKTSYFSK
jgi:hypothetical protein